MTTPNTPTTPFAMVNGVVTTAGMADFQASQATAAQQDALRAFSTKWAVIKAKRAQVSGGGVLVAGRWYDTDAVSKMQHLANKDTARDMLAAGASTTDALLDPTTSDPIIWRTMSNGYALMTIQIALDIVKAAKVLEMSAFANAETHRAGLAAAAVADDYDDTPGWPQVFADT